MKILLPFALAIIQTSLFAQKEDAPKYFEGYIDYKTEYKSGMKGVSDNELRDQIGNFVRIYYKGSSFKWEIRDDAGYIKHTMLYDGKTNTTYSWDINSPDTLFSFNVKSTNRLRVDSFWRAEDDTVNNCRCIQMAMQGVSIFENMTDSLPMKFNYFFCPDIKTNPEWFKNYKEMRWNEIVNLTSSISVKIIIEYIGYYTSIQTAYLVKPEAIDDKLFEIDKSKVMKKTYVSANQ